MKKIFLIIIIIIAVAVLLAGFLYFRMSKSERYALRLNLVTEGGLRNEVRKSAYYELNKEGCMANNYQGFSSIEDCQKTVNCYANETANIIPKGDLKDLAKNMDQGERAESAMIDYLASHTDVNDVLEPKLQKCLTDAGFTL